MSAIKYPLFRVDGHAGLWWFRGQAIVTNDTESFEHDLVIMQHAAEPGHYLTVDVADVHEVKATTEAVA